MPPHLLVHAGHFMTEALTGATEEGGGWAWLGLIAGGVVGYFLTFNSGGPWTPELIAAGLFVCGAAMVSGAYLGCLAKLTVDHLNGVPPKSE